ncbi:MAG: DUF4331 domain-containing protein, partial [Actinomycetota bacterium]|nr:DUF4331 domain-containing protein [Actinomycetota bacterium]
MFVAAGASAALALAGLAAPSATASSHREAPLIAGIPQLDNTDVYAFVSPDDKNKVTLIANWVPFEDPSGGPNFYPFAEHAAHDLNIDSDGDAKADIVYRWVFHSHYKTGNTFLYNTGPVTSLSDPTLNFTQTYDLNRITKAGSRRLLTDAPVAPSYVGKASMPNYGALRQQAITGYGSGAKSFAGQADDPFFLDLRVFDLLYGGDLSEVGNDTLAGYNVNTIALQVPKGDLLGGGDPIFAMWSTTSPLNSAGTAVQVSRLGNPLVNEVVIPLKDKDRFNASKPVNDPQFLNYVTDPELARLIQSIYGIPAPTTPRNDLVQVFLTGVPGLNKDATFTAPGDELRLNTGIAPTAQPNRLGVIGGDTAGFPNGRRLGDDVIDISLQVVEGELVGAPNDLGDAVNANDKAFGAHFPYVALPFSGSRPRPHVAAEGTTLLNGGKANPGSPDAPGLPVLPASGALLATLLAGAGFLSLRRQRRSATAAA